MADERSSPVVDGWITALSDAFNGVALHGAAQSDAAQNWFDETDNLQQGRQGRLAEAPRVIPTTIWILLLIAGLAVAVFSPLFSDAGERLWAQLALGLAVTTAVAASLLTVNFLDRPYGDHEGAIEPTAMRSALATMERSAPPSTGRAVDATLRRVGPPGGLRPATRSSESPCRARRRLQRAGRQAVGDARVVVARRRDVVRRVGVEERGEVLDLAAPDARPRPARRRRSRSPRARSARRPRGAPRSEPEAGGLRVDRLRLPLERLDVGD